MIESWRWYGDLDRITLPQIRQTGASAIVTALHEIPYGHIWDRATIAARRDEIRSAGMTWDVVESLPVAENIKRGNGNLETLFANYRQSMANLAAEGVRTICYNFMPLVDWTRTDLAAPVAGGGTCLRFSAPKMAAFEVHMLKRDGAENDYDETVLNQAAIWFQASTQADRDTLVNAIMAGLPGAFDRYDIPNLRRALQAYEDIGKLEIRSNYKRFLDEVIPCAQELGIKMCVHPDDPPRDILGLPRIVSNAEDIDWILSAHDCIENGLTLCTGSLGAGPENDPVAIAQKHSARIHFAHLRNVTKAPDGSFEEAAHLDGDTDMVSIARILVNEEKRRRDVGRADCAIPYRPDHGHELLMDETLQTVPGYPLIGRMRGLAELRGVFYAVSH